MSINIPKNIHPADPFIYPPIIDVELSISLFSASYGRKNLLAVNARGTVGGINQRSITSQTDLDR